MILATISLAYVFLNHSMTDTKIETWSISESEFVFKYQIKVLCRIVLVMADRDYPP